MRYLIRLLIVLVSVAVNCQVASNLIRKNQNDDETSIFEQEEQGQKNLDIKKKKSKIFNY